MMIRPYSPASMPLRSETTGIVMFNPAGSSTLNDTGRDARHLANATGLHVIAADRPGSGIALPNRGKALASNFIGELSRFAGRCIMPEVQRMGLSQVVLLGRSAAGQAALVTACTEQLPVRAVHSQEQVGWFATTVEAGGEYYKEYMAWQEQVLDADQQRPEGARELIHPEATDQTGALKLIRAGLIVVNFLVDKANYSEVWSQDLSLRAAEKLATDLPRIRADLCFAEHSLVATAAMVHRAAIDLPEMRHANGGEDAEPFTVITIPRTVHGSFDLRSFSAATLQEQTLAHVLPAAT